MDDATPNDGETDPFRLAEQERWLDLAFLGKDAWNTWAKAYLDKPVDERPWIDFAGSQATIESFRGFWFPGFVDFSRSSLNCRKPLIDFRDCIFFGKVDFTGSMFRYYTDFRGSRFQDRADFRECEFRNYADFSRIAFLDTVNFEKSEFFSTSDFRITDFSLIANFRNSKFHRTLNLSDSCIKSEADFEGIIADWKVYFDNITAHGNFSASGSRFNGLVSISNSIFYYPPNFLSTDFSQTPIFLSSFFNYPTRGWLGRCEQEDGEARFRRLKQLAAGAHDHELELSLFASELKAKRFHSLKPNRLRDLARFCLNYIYEWTSDFGQSWMRPLGWLAATILCALYAYESMLGTAYTLAKGVVDFSSIAKVASFANVFPFAGQAVVGREIMVRGLCPSPEGEPPPLDCLTTLYTISAVEGVFGLIFLFLIGLGLRNRFRIK